MVNEQGMNQVGQFHIKVASPLNEYTIYDVYMEDKLVAKVKGIFTDNKMVIPVSELSDSQEDDLYQYLDHHQKFTHK